MTYFLYTQFNLYRGGEDGDVKVNKLGEDTNYYAEINLTEYICSESRALMRPAGMAMFLNLLVFAARNDITHATDRAALARLAGVSRSVFRKNWPQVSRFFEETPEGHLRLKPPHWLKIGAYPQDRRSLAHLLPSLIEFWGAACAYCGGFDGSLDIEHIIPISRGGSNDRSNLTVACRACNLKKRTMTAAEFGHPHIHEKAASWTR